MLLSVFTILCLIAAIICAIITCSFDDKEEYLTYAAILTLITLLCGVLGLL